MKYLVLMITVMLMACSGKKSTKTTPSGAPFITFNGIKIGTPIDTVAYRLGGKPVLQTEDEIDYQNIMAEGVHWDTVTYKFVGGELARVSATQASFDEASYQKLYKSLMEQYGKPAQNVDSLTIWARWNAELALQPGTILFSRR